jgi:hypothetical protein
MLETNENSLTQLQNYFYKKQITASNDTIHVVEICLTNEGILIVPI